MRNNVIVVSADPRGKFEEGTIIGTPLPGTCMEHVPDVGLIATRFSFRAVSSNDGARGPVCILREDELQGKGPNDAYVSGKRGHLYWPVNGEEFNMRLRTQAGTGTSLNDSIGERLEIDGATGMLQGVGTGGGTGSHENAPFMLLENVDTVQSTNSLVWVRYVGNG